MAMLNELVGVAARFNEYLTRKFSIVGGAPSPQLTPEITPVDVIGLDFADRGLMRETAYSWMIHVAAGGAGKYNMMQIRNPTGSGLLIILEDFLFSHGEVTSVSVAFNAGLASTDLTNVIAGGGQVRDVRYRTAVSVLQSAGILSWKNDAGATITGAIYASMQGGVLHMIPLPIVLPPGGNATIALAQENIATKMGFVWHERPAGKNELLLL